MRTILSTIFSLLLFQASFCQEELEIYNSALSIIKSSKTFNDFTKDERNKNIVVHFEIFSICENGWYLDNQLISEKCEKDYRQVVSENFKLNKFSDRGEKKYIAWVSEIFADFMIIQIIHKKNRGDMATFIFEVKNQELKIKREFIMSKKSLDN